MHNTECTKESTKYTLNNMQHTILEERPDSLPQAILRCCILGKPVLMAPGVDAAASESGFPASPQGIRDGRAIRNHLLPAGR